MAKERRKQSLGEEIGNAITHGVGAILAIIGTVFMLLKADSVSDYVGVSIFGLCMLLLYSMSSLYHAFRKGSKVKRVFRVFDHLSIFLLIGGTYAPILLSGLHNTIGYIFFGIQWGIIAIGIVCKVLIKTKTTILHTIICCLLGWSGIIILPYVYQISPTFFYLVLGGGLSYMAGIFFYAFNFKYSHFVWHFFVLFGTFFHFFAIYYFIL